MNKLILITLLVAATFVCVNKANPVGEIYDFDKAEALFEEYIQNFNKEYKDEEEKQNRFEIFKSTLKKINEHNSQNLSYTLGLNQFADRTAEELKVTRGKIRFL